ncbi:hypothetical protein Tco_1345922 [Tanacetum coccineum]
MLHIFIMSNGSAFTSNHRGKAKTTQPWTTAEKTTLCTAWCNTMDNYGTGDSMKRGFWSEVFANFEKEMGRTIRGYDTIVAKWKHSIRPKIVAFSVVYDGVQRMDDSGSSNLVLFQNALAEFENSDERVVGWTLEGIPLHVWVSRYVAKIGNKWGEALGFEDRSLAPLLLNSDVESDDVVNVNGVFPRQIFSDNVMNVMLMVMRVPLIASSAKPHKTSVTHANVGEFVEDGPTNGEDKVDELDRAVSRDEIRRAVWNCGENKSPGPDGYTSDAPLCVQFSPLFALDWIRRLLVAYKMELSRSQPSFRPDVRDGATGSSGMTFLQL